jgi:hypothetical protein
VAKRIGIAPKGQVWHGLTVSMAEIMREVADWPSERQNELAAFLLHLRLQKDSEWRSEMTRRIDDKNPGNWIQLSEWKKTSESIEER